jgi:general secretion pathway protein B
MSYILEALKKADADRERERAGVPDLHAQPDAVAPDARAAGHHGSWTLLALVAALLLVAAAAWQWFGSTPAAPEATAPAPVAVATPAPVAGVAPAQVPMAPEMAPAQTAVPVPAPVQMQTAQRPAVPAAAALRAVSPPRPASAASATTESRLYALAELPPDVRAQLPALAVGGSVYSAAAASRIVIINGQVFREGDRPVEGLSVEQIRLKSTVLAFRGYRIELKH